MSVLVTSKKPWKKYTIDFQLAPPHMHRLNTSERSIGTFKNQFVSEFSTTDQDLPISKWDWLLSQCLITLNLLHNPRVNPALSVYAYLYWPYGFNKYLMALPVTCMIVHEKPGNWTPWVYHGKTGWYIGPSLDNFRCMQCYTPSTVIVRITDTLPYILK